MGTPGCRSSCAWPIPNQGSFFEGKPDDYVAGHKTPHRYRKIECARRFFAEMSKRFAAENVRYDVVDSYAKLMDVVK